MKDFLTVLRFELFNFYKNKAFIISTLVVCLLLSLGLSYPTIKDALFPSTSEEEVGLGESIDGDQIYGFVDINSSISNKDDLLEGFLQGQLMEIDSIEGLEAKVDSGEFEGGYLIETPIKYIHVVKNNEMMSSSRFAFEEALTRAYRMNEFESRGIEYNEVEDLIYVPIEQDIKVLGKDSANNFIYTYILIFGLYFIVVLYGQLIAVSVASEKSNRAMEVLITSTSSKNLIFGKVIGGALAGITQFAIVIITALIAYKFNAAAWDNALDFVFKIPIDVILTFSVFGILGYLFYSFIYGALGALVSRTEDINASATPITLIYVGVFMIAVMGMQNTEGIILKVASFVPLSSFMAMFVRVSMGTVSTIEVIISLGLLVISTVLIAILASMIYRMGTLMYGNPIKLKNAIKLLKSNNN